MGPRPDSRCDKMVKSTIYDSFLCPLSESIRAAEAAGPCQDPSKAGSSKGDQINNSAK
jgi:hypothetical protein